ncbi:MAG TPA: hypothetical protein VMB49_03380 [Acidobacteriaceae bacterium]|nr:hypothetical protein [Acidobacteriaceae bacterium]
MILASRCFDLVCLLLEPEEREAVQGDLLEAGESGWQSLLAVLGLVVRREVDLWRHWRPWLAAFGLALPSSFLLMGFSLSVSRAYQQLMDAPIHHATGLTLGPGLMLFLCNVLLLAAWSWTGGFVVGSVSRRTVWVSAGLCFAPCLFCLERFRVESLSRLCLLLFLPAAIWGAQRGLQIVRIRRSSALALAVGVTALTVPLWTSSGAWIPNWALSWPAWYLVATARRG